MMKKKVFGPSVLRMVAKMAASNNLSVEDYWKNVKKNYCVVNEHGQLDMSDGLLDVYGSKDDIGELPYGCKVVTEYRAYELLDKQWHKQLDFMHVKQYSIERGLFDRSFEEGSDNNGKHYFFSRQFTMSGKMDFYYRYVVLIDDSDKETVRISVGIVPTSECRNIPTLQLIVDTIGLPTLAEYSFPNDEYREIEEDMVVDYIASVYESVDSKFGNAILSNSKNGLWGNIKLL